MNFVNTSLCFSNSHSTTRQFQHSSNVECCKTLRNSPAFELECELRHIPRRLAAPPREPSPPLLAFSFKFQPFGPQECPSYDRLLAMPMAARAGTPYLEQSAPTCHVRTLYVCFPRSPQGFPFQPFLFVTFAATFVTNSACTVAVVILKHLNHYFSLVGLVTINFYSASA